MKYVILKNPIWFAGHHTLNVLHFIDKIYVPSKRPSLNHTSQKSFLFRRLKELPAANHWKFFSVSRLSKDSKGEEIYLD